MWPQPSDFEAGPGRQFDVGEKLALNKLGNELGTENAEEPEAAEEEDHGHRDHGQRSGEHLANRLRVVHSHGLERAVEEIEEGTENGGHQSADAACRAQNT